MRSLCTPLLWVCLLLSAPGFAQDGPDQAPAGEGAVEHRARVAARYEFAAWPKSGPSVTGWGPDACEVAGWERLRVRVDARRAEARVDFALRAAESEGPRRAGARLTLRRHPSPAEAREALLAHLGLIAGVLTREEGLGEVAFGTRVEGRLVYLAGVRGDLTYALRPLTQSGDVGALAAGLDAQLRAAAATKSAPAKPRARLAQSKVGAPQAGQPIAVRLDFEGEVRDLALDAGEQASALRTETGCVVYPEGEGPLELRVIVCDKELRLSRHTIKLR